MGRRRVYAIIFRGRRLSLPQRRLYSLRWVWHLAGGRGGNGCQCGKKALELGFRHIDTASYYGNEKSVGQAIRESGIPRDELFVTTKLWNSDHGYHAAKLAFERSLAALQMDYVDLYLIHWPNPAAFRSHWQESNAETWQAMEELYQAGKIRAIGVSNFMPHHLDALLCTAKVVPAVNQIRLCPGSVQPEVTRYCKAHQILLEGYSPLGGGAVFQQPELKQMAEKYGKSISQLCLRWHIQNGFIPLPKSVTPERIFENTQLFDFSLSDADMNFITQIESGCGAAPEPDQVDF